MHTFAVDKRLFQRCITLLGQLQSKTAPPVAALNSHAVSVARDCVHQRTNALAAYMRRFDDVGGDGVRMIDRIDSFRGTNATTKIEFLQNHLIPNIPCIIDDIGGNFDALCSLWRKDDGTINREWFRDTLPQKGWLPITLNDESNTRKSIAEWLEVLTQPRDTAATMYLKDWHFFQWIHEYTDMDLDPLKYQVPDHFEHDLLNNAADDDCDIANYRFVYWGPGGSKTGPHTDVLKSYSWSYNVSGVKQWTIYLPNKKSFEFQQHAGQTVFMPSMWEHSVINLEETLSINHNWVTAANVDYMWQAIEEDMSEDESMLREVTGHSVNTFFFLILRRGLEVLVAGQNNASTGDWVRSFELQRLGDIMETILLRAADLSLKERLDHALHKRYYDDDDDDEKNEAEMALDMAWTFVHRVREIEDPNRG